MGNIRINLLARELEVKSHLILEYLAVLGIEKKSHSSALDDEIADKVREHFRGSSEAGETLVETPAATPEAPVAISEPPAAVAEPRRLPDIVKAELQHPLVRSLEEIKSAARKAMMPPPPPKVVHVPEVPLQPVPVAPKPTPPVIKPVAPPPLPIPTPAPSPAMGGRVAPTPPQEPSARPAVTRPPSPAVVPAPKVGLEMPVAPVARASGVIEAPGAPSKTPEVSHAVANAIAHGKPTRAARLVRRDPSASQPIYPHAVKPKVPPVRPVVGRRPGEPRPMHPTSARPAAPAAAGALATGGVPSARPPVARPMAPPQRFPGAPPAVPFKPIPLEEVPITRKMTITEGIAIFKASGEPNNVNQSRNRDYLPSSQVLS